MEAKASGSLVARARGGDGDRLAGPGLEPHHLPRKHRMDYARLRQDGYPIGSGTVEGGISTVVHSRMKRQGRGWKRPHAQAMLAALGELHSDRFQLAWQAVC